MTPGSEPQKINAQAASKLLDSLTKPVISSRVHLTEDEVIGVVTESLTSEELADCEAHLEACEQCMASVAELSDEIEPYIRPGAPPARLPNNPFKSSTPVVAMPAPSQARVLPWSAIAAGLAVSALGLSGWLAHQLSQTEFTAAEYQRLLAQRDERIRSLEASVARGASDAIAKVVSFALHRASGTRGGSGADSPLRIPGDVESVQLQLEAPAARDVDRYEFELRNVDAGIVFSAADVRPALGSSGNLLQVQVPAKALVSGDYTALLNAVSKSGTHTGVTDYAFSVVR